MAVAVPALGCGLGGLDWAVVKPLIENAFADLPSVRVLLFELAGILPAPNATRPHGDWGKVNLSERRKR